MNVYYYGSEAAAVAAASEPAWRTWLGEAFQRYCPAAASGAKASTTA
jgi:hypothetical protein